MPGRYQEPHRLRRPGADGSNSSFSPQRFLATEIALRPWAAFVVHVLGEAPRDEIISSSRGAAISDALPALGLVPRPAAVLASQPQRELSNNRHIAQLRDPNGRETRAGGLAAPDRTGGLHLDHEEDGPEAASDRRAAAREYILDRSEASDPQPRCTASGCGSSTRRRKGARRADPGRARAGWRADRAIRRLGDHSGSRRQGSRGGQRLIDDDTDIGDGRSLFEVIPAVLRRRVERMATPAQCEVDEPLRGILQSRPLTRRARMVPNSSASA